MKHKYVLSKKHDMTNNDACKKYMSTSECVTYFINSR